MMFSRALVAVLLFASTASAGSLPGFRLETLAHAEGFVSSVATDSHGTIYLSTTDGWIHRVDGTETTRMASLPTAAGGNGGLLGIALLDDDTAVAHYTTWDAPGEDNARVLDDVVSLVDLRTGAETVLHAFTCDIHKRENGASSEHHGGNVTVGADGAIYVGIGDYGSYAIAQKPEWNAGKIWRIDPVSGEVRQWARGVRNPYDLAWDPEVGRVIVADNGATANDEISVVAEGDNCGWPVVSGHEPAEGMLSPAYVFPTTVAPTGLLRLSGATSMLRRGYLVGAFVTRALYYFPSVVADPVADPIAVLDDLEEFVIDVAESLEGGILVATASFAGSSVHRLHVPPRGDCNGDGFADWRDIYPMLLEIADGESHPMIEAQDGDYAGSWGCDANADGAINRLDLDALHAMLGGRRRAVGHR